MMSKLEESFIIEVNRTFDIIHECLYDENPSCCEFDYKMTHLLLNITSLTNDVKELAKISKPFSKTFNNIAFFVDILEVWDIVTNFPFTCATKPSVNTVQYDNLDNILGQDIVPMTHSKLTLSSLATNFTSVTTASTSTPAQTTEAVAPQAIFENAKKFTHCSLLETSKRIVLCLENAKKIVLRLLGKKL